MAKKNTQQPQEQFKTMIGGAGPHRGHYDARPGEIRRCRPHEGRPAAQGRAAEALAEVVAEEAAVHPRHLQFLHIHEDRRFRPHVFRGFLCRGGRGRKRQGAGRFEAWLEKRLSSEKAQNALITFSVVLGLAFSIALFFVLPSLLGSFLNRFVTTNEIVRNLLEGLLRIVIFLAYMFLVSA